MTVNVTQAVSTDDLRRKLRQQGIAGAIQVTVVEGLDGEYNAGVFFADPEYDTQCVRFRTSEIAMDDAHRTVRDLATLKRQPADKVGRRARTTITPYQ